MTIKRISGAVQADVDVCNALVPPVAGCNAGSGLHVVIRPDFAAAIAAGQDVPGCTYARLESDSSLYVDRVANARINVPALVLALPPQQRGDAAQTIVKLNTATVLEP